MSQPRRVVLHRHGGPQVLEIEPFEPGEPGPGEVLVRHEAVGVNFIDIYFRKGVFQAPFPIAPGSEAAGTIVALGSGVRGLQEGDRVVCISSPGAYATHRIVPAERVVALPADVSCETAAASMMKGLTAGFLAEDIRPLGAGQTALVHSAAGGVGALLVFWLSDLGVDVIAHCGTAEKAASVDARHSLACPFGELAGEVRRITGGKGVDVVFDGVGVDSWTASLGAVARRGLIVSYGHASGPVPPLDLLDLMRAGSISVVRPTLSDFIVSREDLLRAATRLFAMIRKGLPAGPSRTYALTDAAQAHADMENRRTTGSVILIP